MYYMTYYKNCVTLDRIQFKTFNCFQENFLKVVKQLLAKAAQEKEGTSKKQAPKLPSAFTSDIAEEIHSILKPFGEMTDILQADTCTSNNVFYNSATSLRSA